MSVRFSADGQDFTSTDVPVGTSFTVACWVRLASDRNAVSTVWCLDDGAGNFLALKTDSSGTSLRGIDTSGDVTGAMAMTVGNWYFTCYTYNSGTTTGNFFHASQAVADLTAATTSTTHNLITPTTLRIGDSSTGGEWWDGNIAGFKVYSGVATGSGTAAQDRWSMMPVRTLNLHMWFPFDQAIGTDFSGNGFDLSGGSGTTTEDGPGLHIAPVLVVMPPPSAVVSNTVDVVAVDAVADVPAVAVQAGSGVAPAVVEAVASVPAVTVTAEAGATVSPAVVAAVASVGAVSLSTSTVVSPTVVAAVATVPAPTVRAGAGVSPAVVVAVAGVPAPTVQAGSGVAAAVVAAVASVPSPTVGASSVVSPAVVAAVAAVPAASVQAGAGVAAAVVAAVASVPAPTVRAGAGATPSTVAAVAAVPAPTVRLGAAVTPGTVPAVATVPAPQVQAGSRAVPAAVVAVASVPASTVRVSAAVTPAAAAATATVPAVTVATGSRVSPATVAAVATTPTSVQTGVWIQPYYPKSRFADPLPANLPFNRMTHLAVFSMAPTTTGGVVNTAGADLTATLPTIVTAAHAAGVNVLVTVGGSTAAPDTTWRSAVNSTNRATFVANIVAFISTYDLDGVDIDWEPFDTSSDATDFALFIADLRTALGTGPLITIFLAITPAWKRTLANTIQANVDRFGLSTYDLSYATTITVHDSPLYTSGAQPVGKSAHEAVTNFVAAGVAPTKLNIGAPFYAQRWAGETALHDTATTNAFTAVTYRSLAGASSTTEPTGALYDTTAKAAYINGDPWTSFSSVQAIADKLAYINSAGIGGIILWEIGQGYFSATEPHFPHMEVFAGTSDNNAAPATVQATATVPAPTVQAGAAPTPARVQAVATVGSASVRTGSTVTAATVTATAAVPAPTVRVSAAISPARVQAAAAVGAPTIGAGAGAAPVVVAAAADVPAPTVRISAAITPAAVAAVASVPGPSVRTGSTVAAVQVQAVASVPAPTVTTTAAGVVPAVRVAAVAAVPAPTVRTGSAATASAVQAVTAVPAPTVRISAAIAPARVQAVAAVPAVAVAASSAASPAPVAALAGIPTPTVQAGANVTASPAVVAAAATVGTVQVGGGAGPAAGTVTATATVPTPTVQAQAGALITPAVVAAYASVPAAVVAVAYIPPPDILGGTTVHTLRGGVTARVYAGSTTPI